MVPHRLPQVALIAGLAFCSTGCGPVTASLHDPHALPALEQDGRVHYEPGAKSYAEAVAKVLPRAVAKIEAVQGAPFGGSFIVVAYADEDAYAAANGMGSKRVSGVTFFNRITLSPRLWREEPEQLEAYLTHELSHEHLFSHLGALGFQRIPAWFREGLAVMASGGGGAQRVSVAEASRAIAAGQVIETPDETYLIGNSSLDVAAWTGSDIYRRVHMAYRQAGMFIAYINGKDPAAFKSLLHRLLSGERFKPAFEASFGSSVADNWQSFAAAAARS